MAWALPFDLFHWFVTVLSGDLSIFLGLAFIGIAALAAYFKMPNSITLLSLILFTVFMGEYAGEFYILSIILTSVFIFTIIPKLVTR